MRRVAAPEVSAGDHACCLFASDDDQAAVIGKFARNAADRRDRIFYVADRADDEKVTAFLADAGLEGRAMLDSGALQVLPSSQMGLEDGFDRDRQMAVWDQLVAAARDDGYRGLAVAVEMSWALSWQVDLDALIEYEATADAAFASGHLSALCQYDRRIFGDEMIDRAHHAHRYGIAVDDSGCSVDYKSLLLRLEELDRTIELGGDVDLANVHFLQRVLAEQLANGDAVADLHAMSFIDVAGCRLLREARDGKHGGKLMLRNEPEIVARVMQALDAR